MGFKFGSGCSFKYLCISLRKRPFTFTSLIISQKQQKSLQRLFVITCCLISNIGWFLLFLCTPVLFSAFKILQPSHVSVLPIWFQDLVPSQSFEHPDVTICVWLWRAVPVGKMRKIIDSIDTAIQAHSQVKVWGGKIHF